MNSSADRVENVVESGIGRLLLREEMMRKRAVGRPQEWRRQAESGQVVAQSAVGDAAPLQFAQFRLVGRRFARRVVDDDVAALLLLLGSVLSTNWAKDDANSDLNISAKPSNSVAIGSFCCGCC